VKSPLHILHLEDNEDDAILIHALLKEQGVTCRMERVDTREGFVAALDCGDCDVILSDFTLPGFSGLAALDLAREMRPEVPFLFVSGTLREEAAIDCLQHGATDYVLKDRPSRLGAAIRRAVTEAGQRRALSMAEQAMIQSEHKYRQLFEFLAEAAILADAESGRVIDANRQAEALLHRTRAEIIGQNQDHFLSPQTRAEYRRRFAGMDCHSHRTGFDGEVLTGSDQSVPVTMSVAPLALYGRRLMLSLFRERGESTGEPFGN
jgi:PAS domain S-box-containing protein